MKFFWNVNIDSRTCKTLKCCWQFVKRNWQFLHQLATILGPEWCHCHPKTRSSLASLKSRLVLPFWYQHTQFVLVKRLLNGCSVVVSPPSHRRRPCGRPCTIWLRAIDARPVSVGIHSAWRKASDRMLWRHIIDTATLHHGAYHWRKESSSSSSIHVHLWTDYASVAVSVKLTW